MNHTRERGTALLVVLTLVVIISALFMANTMVLHQLRSELRRLDQKQQDRLVMQPVGQSKP